jgi:DNA-binding transcriptional regulator YhcF (GntR family)
MEMDAASREGSRRAPASLVRERLLMALHFGQKRPGDRVPSIRTMSRVTGLGRKAVHRAYEQLAGEGLLEMRPGSGTYFAEGGLDALRVSLGRLLGTMERFHEDAEDLGLSLDQLARVLTLYSGARPVEATLAVTECNREQLGLISQELDVALSAGIRPILIDDLKADSLKALDGCVGVVTTDCHMQEVQGVVQPFGLPTYRVALSSSFTETLVRAATDVRLLMVVQDGRYGAILTRMLDRMGVPRETVERLEIVDVRRGRRRIENGARGHRVYLSPLVEERLDASAIPARRRVHPGPYLDAPSVEHLRAQVAADMALQSSHRSAIPHPA